MKTDRLESLQIGHFHTKDVFNDLQICLVGKGLSGKVLGMFFCFIVFCIFAL